MVGVREVGVGKEKVKGCGLGYGMRGGEDREEMRKGVVGEDGGWVCMGEE